jgi:hypothetical protein
MNELTADVNGRCQWTNVLEVSLWTRGLLKVWRCNTTQSSSPLAVGSKWLHG